MISIVIFFTPSLWVLKPEFEKTSWSEYWFTWLFIDIHLSV